MEMLSYFLVSIISFIGLFVGYLIMLSASEEQKPGRKYFRNIRLAVLWIFIAASFLVAWRNYALLGIMVIFLIWILWRRSEHLNYAFFSIIFFFASHSKLISVVAVLIFLYGIALSAELDLRKKKNSILYIVSYIHFIILSLFFRIFLR